MRLTAPLVLVSLCLGSTANADPFIGTTLHVGEALAGDANTRVGSTIYVTQPLQNGWLVGGELSGSVEGYLGGYGCGTYQDSEADVPSVAVSCFQPGVAAHVLVGVQAFPSARSLLRVEGGLGGTTLFLVPGQGGSTQHDIVPSGLVRASYLFRAGEALGADWWLGAALEERAMSSSDVALARSIGLVVEGHSR